MYIWTQLSEILNTQYLDSTDVTNMSFLCVPQTAFRCKLKKTLSCIILPLFSRFFSFLAWKTLKTQILTSVWSVQNPNTGQNIQHMFNVQIYLKKKHLSQFLEILESFKKFVNGFSFKKEIEGRCKTTLMDLFLKRKFALSTLIISANLSTHLLVRV